MATMQFHKTLGIDPATELLHRGYTRRTTTMEPRLSEIVEEYRRIGFEVEVIEHQAESDRCGICFEPEGPGDAKYCDVYVRRPPSGSGGAAS